MLEKNTLVGAVVVSLAVIRTAEDLTPLGV